MPPVREGRSLRKRKRCAWRHWRRAGTADARRNWRSRCCAKRRRISGVYVGCSAVDDGNGGAGGFGGRGQPGGPGAAGGLPAGGQAPRALGLTSIEAPSMALLPRRHALADDDEGQAGRNLPHDPSCRRPWSIAAPRRAAALPTGCHMWRHSGATGRRGCARSRERELGLSIAVTTVERPTRPVVGNILRSARRRRPSIHERVTDISI